MLKKLNVFALTLLIIGQTILGPMGIVSAASDLPEPIEQTTTVDELENLEQQGESSISTEPSEESDAVDPAPTPETKEVDEDAQAVTEEPKADATEEKSSQEEAEAPVSVDNEADAVEENEEVSAAPEQEQAIEEDEELEENADIMQVNVPEDVDLESDVKMTFSHLDVNGKMIYGVDDALDVYPALGDKIGVFFDFKITPSQDAGIGSSFTFDLPPGLLEFDTNQLSGEFSDDNVKLEYTTKDKVVTVTVIEGQLVNGLDPFTGTFQFWAKFNEDGSKDGLEQELEVPILGGDSLKFPFIFKPQNVGESMTKEGASSVEGEDRFITWEVWTNREGAKLSGATLSDTLGEGHKLSGDITVEKYVVGLKGIDENSPISSTTPKPTAFPVSLEDGRYAYKLTYKTKVTRVQQETTERFTNEAILTNGGETDRASASATHTYGTKLEKTINNFHPDTSKYVTKWQVKYNYFGSVFATNTLTDTITGNHKIDGDTVKIYHVDVDASGKGAVGAEVSPQPTVTLSNDDKTLEVTLPSPNGEAYFIEYDSVLTDGFVDDSNNGKRIENKISYDEENSSSQGFNYYQNIFNKSRTSIDYDKKEITWTITVNAEKAMNDFKIIDTFVLDSDGESRQSLIADAGDGKYYVAVNNTKTEVTTTDPSKGFELNLGDVTKGQYFTITYKTKFDIQANGTPYPTYKNIGKGTWKNPDPDDTKDYSVERQADYSPGTSPTGKNGYKNGSFDHVNQVFNWNLAVNINKQEINGATLVDTIEEGHKLVGDSIQVFKLNLSNNDTGTYDKDSPVTSGFKVTDKGDQGFTLKFTTPTTDAYIITYQTVDSDDIIGNEGSNLYENNAVFATIDDTEFPLSASTTVKHANEIIDKNVKINDKDETITWTVDINKSHSALGDGIELRDFPSDNQLILPETFRKREIILDAAGNISYGDWESVTPEVFENPNSFKLAMGNLDKKGYQVEYTTFFLGADGETFSNEASINYEGGTIGVDKDSNVKDEEFNYNASSGTINSTKGNLSIVKYGVDPITGEALSLDGITFELWNISGTVKLASGITVDGGKLLLENIRYGTYLLKESGTPSGYLPIPAEGKEIQMGENTDFLVNGDQDYVIENLKNVDPSNACPTFKITVNGLDKDQEISLKNNLTNKEYKRTTTDGKLVFDRADLPAGEYTVTTVVDGEEVVLDKNLAVQYESDCEAEVSLAPTCPVFTLTVKDVNGEVSKNATVTIVNNETKEEFTKSTDENGKLTFDKLLHGKYTVYEGTDTTGNQLGEITVDEDCEDLVQPAPSCDFFTVTVNNVNGKADANVEVTIQDADGKVFATATTDADGKIEVPSKDLPAGDYKVVKGDVELGDITVDYTKDCEDIVQPAPSCEIFTVTVNNVNGKADANVEVTIQDADGKVFATATTDADGKIEVPSKDLPAGDYKVLKGNVELGDITVDYNTDCEDIVQPAPSCEIFTVTVNNVNGKADANVEVTIQDADGKVFATATTDADGKIEVPSKDLLAGDYKVVKGDVELGDITVDYTKDCEDLVQPAPSCEIFTVTVNNVNGKADANVEVTVQDADGKVFATATTDADGQIEVPSKDLPAGNYKVVKGDIELGDITVDYTKDCEDLVQPAPSCEFFTVIVNNVNGKADANVEVTIQDADGKVFATATTDADGQIEVPSKDLPAGDYKVVKGDVELGDITVDYNTDCEDIVQPAPSCEIFTVTVNNVNGKADANVEVTIQDADGKVFATATTDADGQIEVPSKDLPAGAYKVLKGDVELGDITVDYNTDCEDVVQPAPSCDVFTITVKDENGKNREDGTKVTVKGAGENGKDLELTVENGKVTLPNTTKPGNYKVYEDNAFLGDITVDYLENCEDEVQAAPTCPEFVLTVKGIDGELVKNEDITMKDKAGNEIASGTTDEAGKLYAGKNVPAGDYKVFSGERYLGDVKVDTTCEAEFQVPETCPVFTLTVKDENGERQAGKKVTIVNEELAFNETVTTDQNGQIDIDTLVYGKYTVYEGTDTQGKTLGTFTVDETTDCKAEVQPAPTCPVFTITVKDANGNLYADGTKVTVKEAGENGEDLVLTVEDGKVTLPNTTTPSTYQVYEGETELGDITVDYTKDCEAEVQPAPSCPVFTITVKDANGNHYADGTKVTVKEAGENGEDLVLTVKDGKVTLPNTTKPGTYQVYQDQTKLGDITVDYTKDCEDLVQPAPSCDFFTVTVKDKDGNTRPNVKVTVKDKDGKIVLETTTDKNGKIQLPSDTTPPGTYDVYEGELFLGEVVVDYTDGCEDEISQAPSCDVFTITIQKDDGKPYSNEKVTITDSKGNKVIDETHPEGLFETDQDGNLRIHVSMKPGTYKIYEGTTLLGEFTVEDTCSVLIKLDAEPKTEITPPTKPTEPKPTEPSTPEKPSKPTQGEKPSVGPTTPEKLPQTGEEQFMYMIGFGVLLLAAGSLVLFRQRRKA